uniref:Uncharacterized protein n=1 Tax=Eucampia antarctica TaxID=49252 RepID=A0A7S2S946_9STRA|mmetsp:Transcript_4882/g.4590  ORF Transcript_4882/g.4590 Transcript_4882/m.4590 type:complete len:287 (+) Transcript_4882:46-906(+)|eukprot:CAMPEP_0197831464 /NCGR_PEP_ID=MMETSP1437-20131217/10205_1 /TAXON_ID=49252 ORGANISM="Eucampia antarctica, Strain CCMP1452" /NCGR_SAMPLE_ID=MMETSP1437 /ASSEMBLY_ACC=CAM_ASM_001096 /LENGTH=286 /DNA_ID=CAMNT_0043434387 /DNA_START=40 /DNA_END=900 /DNA_ORIENTATION=+
MGFALHIVSAVVTTSAFQGAQAFSVPQKSIGGVAARGHPTQLFGTDSRNDDDNNINGLFSEERNSLSRSDFISSAFALSSSLLILGNSFPAGAEDETSNDATPVAFPAVVAVSSSSTARTIDGCPKAEEGKNGNCISSSNIKELDRYSPPWSFEVSAEEAFARLKGALTTDSTMTITELDKDAMYIKAELQRNSRGTDEMQFLIRADDKVVIFKANEKEDSFDYDMGANRNRMETLRKKAVVFDLMGGGLTADTFSGDSRKSNGVLGQLNSFFGFNNGAGFEDVFD